MRLPGSAFAVALAGMLVVGESDAAAALAGIVLAVLLVLLGCIGARRVVARSTAHPRP